MGRRTDQPTDSERIRPSPQAVIWGQYTYEFRVIENGKVYFHSVTGKLIETQAFIHSKLDLAKKGHSQWVRYCEYLDTLRREGGEVILGLTTTQIRHPVHGTCILDHSSMRIEHLENGMKTNMELASPAKVNTKIAVDVAELIEQIEAVRTHPEFEDNLELINSFRGAENFVGILEAAVDAGRDSILMQTADMTAFALLLKQAQGIIAASDADKRKSAKLLKEAIVTLPGEQGAIYMKGKELALLELSVKQGMPVLLIGEPGAAKTEIARAMAAHTKRELYFLEVSGMSDVSQLEAERVIKTKETKQGIASYTDFVPTALIRALEAHEAGADVLLVIDELPRVQDAQILNPLFMLLTHGEYNAVVTGKTYRVNRERFSVIATGNLLLGYNFSGNNRKGLDDALFERWRVILCNRPNETLVNQILLDRTTLSGVQRSRVCTIYDEASKGAERGLMTLRVVLDLARVWTGLGDAYSLTEVLQMTLSPRSYRSPELATAIIAKCESRSW